MTTATATNNLQITKDRIKSWGACSDGYRWFLAKFPDGGQFSDVHSSLIEDKRVGDADWLASKAFEEFDTATRVKQIAIIAGADEKAIAAQVAAGSEAATTGEGANAATTGNWANAATTGYRANAATTGKHAVAASLGNDAKAKAGAGGAIVLTHRNDDGELICIRAAMVGQHGIEPDVWYSLDAAGQFVKAED